MSTFGDKFTEVGITKLASYLGDSATYTALDGTATSVTVISFEEAGFEDQFIRAQMVLPKTDIASPSRGGEVSFKGFNWAVINIQDDEAGAWILRARRPEAIV